jgi:hypothetical protein
VFRKKLCSETISAVTVKYKTSRNSKQHINGIFLLLKGSQGDVSHYERRSDAAPCGTFDDY